MAELTFEWDEEKNAANINNHGIDFLDAALIFEKPTLEAIDDRADYGRVEVDRFGVIGRDGAASRLYLARRKHRPSSARGKQTDMTQKNTTVRYSLSAIKKKIARGTSKTRADAPEAAPVGEAFWKRARVVMPRGKTSVHLRIDRDVFDWFKKQGEGHLTRMNAVLRSYVDAQRR
jgi:uncharacterized protein (DUF4415 family)